MTAALGGSDTGWYSDMELTEVEPPPTGSIGTDEGESVRMRLIEVKPQPTGSIGTNKGQSVGVRLTKVEASPTDTLELTEDAQLFNGEKHSELPE